MPASTLEARARNDAPALHPIHAEIAQRFQPGPRDLATAHGAQTPAIELTPQLIHRLAVEGMLP